MGHIKEPDGVDFVINGRPLTKEEELAISNYISTYKAMHSTNKIQSKRTARTSRKKVADPMMKK
jgi:hypothetical protein